MNANDAKRILIAFRPGTADAQDAEVAEALEMARRDAELSRWLETHCGRQELIAGKFRQIKAPPGLMEQILSEHAASRRRGVQPTSGALIAALALTAVLCSFLLWHFAPSDTALTDYRNRMVSQALRGYSMNLLSSDALKIQGYLKQEGAPTDYSLPPGLAQSAMVGCATQKWKGAKVSMLCFRTGKPMAPGAQSDLWLFVIDQTSLHNAPKPGAPAFVRVNQLMTATWTSGDKTYLMGVEGDKAYLQTFL